MPNNCGPCDGSKSVGNGGSFEQPFPTSGRLCRNLDLKLRQLIELIGRQSDEVYSYIVKSVKVDRRENGFTQKGCGPNFQGGCLTLCTCKHQMRSRLAVKEWKGKWIAGLTSRTCGKHWLFYLARVEVAYESHCELWFELSEQVKRAKSARLSRLGDLYEPLRRLHDDK